MKTKIAKVEVTTCLFCPFRKTGANHWYDYCTRHNVNLENDKNIAYTDNIPNFCTLPDKEN